MDIRLRGEMDGIQAAEAIRTRFDIPVVYVTANADEPTLQRAKQTEPYGFIIKPFQERELHTTIQMALYKHKMERRLRERERWSATTLRSINDGVITTDRQGVVEYMNPAAEELTGWQQEEAVGRDVARSVSCCQREFRRRHLRASRQHHRGWRHRQSANPQPDRQKRDVTAG